MKRKIQKFVSILLSVIMCCSVFSFNVSSEECSDTIEIYIQKLERFNEKYKTSFELDIYNKSVSDLDEIIVFYSQMTDDEFEEYFLDLKQQYEIWLDANKSIEMVTDNNENYMLYTIKSNNSSRSSPTVTETQRLYYNASTNSNSLNIISSVNYSGGWGAYVSVDRFSSTTYQYPAYIANACDATIKSYSGYCTAECTFSCRVYINETAYVTNSDCDIICTFTAGGGDIYAFTSV
ncbi:MAG: hypothetical protein IJC04_00655 [Oscillospiraceae bacterium]|nr:hypothetical protein [Oscillospiraceae bacterium]